MKRTVVSGIVCLLLFGLVYADKADHEKRLKESATVLKEIMNIPDGIPKDLLHKAECIAVLPSVKKGAFIVGGSFGAGAMVCRTGEDFNGPWGAPSMMRLEGASIGFQIGGNATDFVLLMMNPKAAKGVLTSKVKLGADATAAAGPKGRTSEAGTDATFQAEILSYSRARGVFAGVSLKGSTLRADNKGNQQLYGKEIKAQDIILAGKVSPPDAAQPLVSFLQAQSPKNLSK